MPTRPSASPSCAGSNPIWVAGNHDRAVTGQITTAGFSRTAARAVEWTRPRLSPAELETLAAMPLRAEIEGGLLAVHGAWHPGDRLRDRAPGH